MTFFYVAFFICVIPLCTSQDQRKKLVLLYDDSFTIDDISPQEIDLLGLSSLQSTANLLDLELIMYKVHFNTTFFSITWKLPIYSGVMSISSCNLALHLSKLAREVGTTILTLETEMCTNEEKFYSRNLPLYLAMGSRRFVCAVPEIIKWISRMEEFPCIYQNCTNRLNYREDYIDCLGNEYLTNILDADIYENMTYSVKLEKAKAYVNGRNMTVLTIHRPPFVVIESGKHGQKYSGFCIELLKALAEKFNFTYHFLIQTDGSFGNPLANGSVDGMVGRVHRKEVDFAAAGFTITQSRDTVIDFTNAFYDEPTSILLPAPKEENKLFTFMQPFSIGVWLTLLTSVLIVGPLVYMFTIKFTFLIWLYPRRLKTNHTLYRFVWYTAASLVAQASRLRLTGPSRVLVGVWWISGVIFIYTYNSTLIAFLTVPNMEKLIQSLDELSKQREILWTYRAGTAHDKLFEGGDPNGVYHKIGNLIRENPSMIVYTDKDGIESVINNKMAYIKEKSFLDFVMESDFLTTGECRLAQAPELFFSAGFGWVLPEDAIYLPLFNNEILRMMQAGLFENWKRRYWPKPNQCTAGNTPTARRPRPLQLKNVYGHFLMLGIGCMASITAFILEILKLIIDKCLLYDGY